MEKIIVANWKMNGNLEMIQHHLHTLQGFNAILALPEIYLALSHEILNKYPATRLKLAAQSIGLQPGYGAYTGQVSGAMLKEAGAEYVIIGHSEARLQLCQMLNGLNLSEYQCRQFEDNYLLQQLQNATAADLCPIFCVGESMTTRIDSCYIDFILLQLALLNEIKNLHQVVIAYEPCWAIGSGVTPTIVQITEVVNIINDFIKHKQPDLQCHILYGGSVNNDNIAPILQINNLAGVLVGGSSLQAEKFRQLLITAEIPAGQN